MSKKILIFLVIIVVIGITVYFTMFKPDEVPITDINNFEECISAGYPAMESYPRRCNTPDGKTFTEDIGNELEKFDLIKIDNPRPNQAIENPLFIKGKARGFWFFEADFSVKLFDGNGFLLGVTPARALGEWMTEDFVSFDATFPFAVPSTPKGRLVLEKDNPSGLPEHADELIIPVYFQEVSEASQEFMTVKIFLSDSYFKNEPYFDCSRTIAIERQTPKTLAITKAAVEALLRGATQEEINQGFYSNINSGVRIQSLTIENSIAKVDFDEQLEFQMGGSCRVTAIRAQITETLKQFPAIDDVIISVNGRTKYILQP